MAVILPNFHAGVRVVGSRCSQLRAASATEAAEPPVPRALLGDDAIAALYDGERYENATLCRRLVARFADLALEARRL